MGEGSDAGATVVKALAVAAGLIALSFGIVGVVVLGLHDADTLVSPPEIVAEEFVRALGNGRIQPARSMLASDAEHATPTEEVRLLSSMFRWAVGHLDDVRGTVVARGHDSAVVRAHVEGERANAELTLPLVREHGAWSVAGMDEMAKTLKEVTARETAPR